MEAGGREEDVKNDGTARYRGENSMHIPCGIDQYWSAGRRVELNARNGVGCELVPCR